MGERGRGGGGGGGVENQRRMETGGEAASPAEVKGFFFWRAGTIAYHRLPAAATITPRQNGEM